MIGMPVAKYSSAALRMYGYSCVCSLAKRRQIGRCASSHSCGRVRGGSWKPLAWLRITTDSAPNAVQRSSSSSECEEAADVGAPDAHARGSDRQRLVDRRL